MDTEKIAKDACDYLFRLGKHSGAAVEFDPVGYLRSRIDKAVAAEREACARVVDIPVDIGRNRGAWDRGYRAGRIDAAKDIRSRQ